MRISNVRGAYEPELFLKPFGFKGSKLSGVWQTACLLESEGEIGIGLGVQSVLWSDPAVFLAFGEDKSNELMFAVTRYALTLTLDMELEAPNGIIDAVFEKCLEYARKITGMDVTETFVLNALVPLDHAAWVLWARLKGIKRFDCIFDCGHRASTLSSIPLITYATSADEIRRLSDEGTALFKIKIGSDPDGDGDYRKMLEWDIRRAEEIHGLLSEVDCSYTDCGHPVYYFDANGRYPNKALLCELLDALDSRGILARTVLFEEPFAAENKLYVGDLPVCVAADESAHSLADVKERIELGYKAITLKPIAKTASVSMEMAKYAIERGVQCFCADLTVNPVMVEWNKHFAACLPPIKGMKTGVFETNGAQNYRNWDRMLGYMPGTPKNSGTIITLDNDFYNDDGIFAIPEHYLKLAKSDG